METKIPLASGIEVHCAYHAIASIHDLKDEHPEAQLVLYCAAIKARGWRESVTVSKLSGFIVTGAGAVLAARMLGFDQVPLKNIAGVRVEGSYKNTTVGESHVVTFSRFLASPEWGENLALAA